MLEKNNILCQTFPNVFLFFAGHTILHVFLYKNRGITPTILALPQKSCVSRSGPKWAKMTTPKGGQLSTTPKVVAIIFLTFTRPPCFP